MPTPDQRGRISVILVSPRNPLNIGAAARAMANFGFESLTVVAPFAPHWREARSAIGAPQVLADAVETASLAEAIAPCTLVIGTGTLTYRRPEQPVLSLPEATPLAAAELQRGGRIAFVFGPEKHGLTREDLSYCHLLIEIPTDPRQPSMNLGQAVAVCLYELATRSLLPETPPAHQQPDAPEAPAPAPFPAEPAARSGTLERLAEVILETMRASGYSPAAMDHANHHDLRLLLRRLAPNAQDTRRILGVFRRILWRLNSGKEGS